MTYDQMLSNLKKDIQFYKVTTSFSYDYLINDQVLITLGGMRPSEILDVFFTNKKACKELYKKKQKLTMDMMIAVMIDRLVHDLRMLLLVFKQKAA